MKGMKIIPLFIIVSLSLIGCEFFNLNSADDYEIKYYSKEVIFSRYVDPDGYDLEPVETWLYGADGKLSIIFKNHYVEPDNSGLFVNDKTEVFEVGESGNTLIEYYMYEYQKDDYQYTDEEGTLVSTFDYIINRGETYDAEGILRLYYTVSYLVLPTEYDVYTSIIDYKAEDDSVLAKQESTYILDGDGQYRYRTEKFYSLPTSTSTVLTLDKEFACWYESASPFRYLYELYHSIRSSDGSEEVFYLTMYHRNDNGDVWEQADYQYDKTGVPMDADNTFTVVPSFTYDILFDHIGVKATVLNTKYDSLGNIIIDERSLNGYCSEYITYRYNKNSELTDQLRYTKGGSLLYDRITVRYSDEMRDGVYYRKTEKTTYKYYDIDEELYSSGRHVTFPGLNGVFYNDIGDTVPNFNRKTINNYHR